MVAFTEAQLVAWISPILWPFVRLLALFSVAPVFSMRAIPMRAKIALAFFIALCAQPMLAQQKVVDFNGLDGIGALIQQIGVGLAIGFAIRLVFASVELAGELIGLQMGLNFASFFDPASNGQVSAVARFFNHIATLLFVVINGHLLVLMALIKSFDTFPVSGNFVEFLGQARLHELGSSIFVSALWIALPMIGLLLFVNLALGIISRVAPQINIYSVGFPVTLTMGLVGIAATLPMFERPILNFMNQAIDLFNIQR